MDLPRKRRKVFSKRFREGGKDRKVKRFSKAIRLS